MKIAVLLSGGVDSAVVVHKLYSEGHDLHLFYIRIGMDDGSNDCSADEDIEMCTLIARKYNLPLQIVPLHQEYWDYVMAYALRTVKEGLTPHPDMMCNKMIKFGFFEQKVGHDYDYTATGHYADIRQIGDTLYLATAPDPVKDQTDFLAQISYSQLKHLMFPLGKMSKAEVRKLAKEANLPNANRKDSQGICFLGKINYNDFIERHLGTRPGPIIDIATGKKLGMHRGYWFHTIGQRKGLGLGGGPWFVVRKNTRDNAVYVSHGYDTSLQYGRIIPVEEMHWISSVPELGEDNSLEVSFKTRHTPHFQKGHIRPVSDLHAEGASYILTSREDVQGIAPGQFAIIYSADKTLCLGSGMISLKSTNTKKSKNDN